MQSPPATLPMFRLGAGSGAALSKPVPLPADHDVKLKSWSDSEQDSELIALEEGELGSDRTGSGTSSGTGSGTGSESGIEVSRAGLTSMFEEAQEALVAWQCPLALAYLQQQLRERHEQWLSRDRLRMRLDFHGFEERVILGDGNCQFASVSDQLFGSPRYHKAVRAAVAEQLRRDPERYSPYVLENPFEKYVTGMEVSGTWGDHVTLQATADAYGVQTMLLTSFAQGCIIEVNPEKKANTGQVLWLSFWAEFHYGSLYPKGKAPSPWEDQCVIA